MEQHLLGHLLAGKYQLVEVLALGAFGVVYKAHQFFCKQFVRPVAVKVSLQTGLTEASAAGLFGDALVLAQILARGDAAGRHHLVQIYDMGLLPEYEGRGFLVLEYVEGRRLLDHIRAAGRMGVRTGLRYVKELCAGLAVLHAQGAVHRDLKPDNVLVDRRGVVRLVDFGLAAFTDPRLGFVPGEMGTFTYMAPETLQGRSTPASDVYALGLLAYELFTGGGPHLTAAWPTPGTSTSADAERLKRSLRFRPPSEVQNEIRNDYRWLDAWLARCLAPDERRRFPDAQRVLEALEAGESGGALPHEDVDGNPAGEVLPVPDTDTSLLREARRLLARQAYREAVNELDVHRPAEWAALDRRGARLLRLLARAYAGTQDWRAARDCLEQLWSGQKEQPVLPAPEFAAALAELRTCYLRLGEETLAGTCADAAATLARAGA